MVNMGCQALCALACCACWAAAYPFTDILVCKFACCVPKKKPLGLRARGMVVGGRLQLALFALLGLHRLLQGL